MGCAACGQAKTDTSTWEVTYPDGTKEQFQGEQNALVAMTRSGGGSKVKVSS